MLSMSPDHSGKTRDKKKPEKQKHKREVINNSALNQENREEKKKELTQGNISFSLIVSYFSLSV